MLLEEERAHVIEIAQTISRIGLVPLTFGNYSLRDPQTGYVCVTPSGMPYATLHPSDIVVVDVDSNVVDGERRPSIETPLHTGIYRRRPDVFGIVHTHSTFCTAWACRDIDGMPCVTVWLTAWASGGAIGPSISPTVRVISWPRGVQTLSGSSSSRPSSAE